MSCDNEKISGLLIAYHDGTLSKDERLLVEKHLEKCESCRKTLKLMDKLSGEPEGETGYRHINTDLLTLYHDSPQSLAPEVIARIEKHLEKCDRCSYELSFLRDLSTELKQSVSHEPAQPTRKRKGRPFLSFLARPAIAYFLVLLLAYPAIQWIALRFSETQQETIAILDGKPQKLRQTSRSAGNYPVVKRRYEDELIVLAIPIYHNLRHFSYTYHLRPEVGKQAWEIEAITNMSKKDIIKLILNGRGIPDGVYTLEFLEVSRSDLTDTTTYNFPFALETQIE